MHNSTERQDILKRVRRVVIKIGSKILTSLEDGLDEEAFLRLAREISQIVDSGYEVIIVTSGAIAAGMKKLGLKSKPKAIPEKQATAAIGQTALMHFYEQAFGRFDKITAQILLTHGDLASRTRFLNAKNTIFTLLERHVIPIINENDTVSVEEIKLGDNDNLSSMVTALAEADLLILLTDIEGFYSCNPKSLPADAKPISIVFNIDGNVESCAYDTSSVEGTGGMITKLQAAKRAGLNGSATIIANGKKVGILREVLDGNDVGTLFLPKKDRVKSRKHWIAYTLRQQGTLTIDDGGVKALIEKKKSLLPSGIIALTGKFSAGSSISLLNQKGEEFARGLVNYNSDEIQKIKGLKTTQINEILGYKYFDEVINRDDLIVL